MEFNGKTGVGLSILSLTVDIYVQQSRMSFAWMALDCKRYKNTSVIFCLFVTACDLLYIDLLFFFYAKRTHVMIPSNVLAASLKQIPVSMKTGWWFKQFSRIGIATSELSRGSQLHRLLRNSIMTENTHPTWFLRQIHSLKKKITAAPDVISLWYYQSRLWCWSTAKVIL